MGTQKEVIQVTWRCDEEPKHVRIENNFYALEGDWGDRYVSFSGYFGKHNPNLFAAAPDLYEALDACVHAIRSSAGPEERMFAVDHAREALAKARGE